MLSLLERLRKLLDQIVEKGCEPAIDRLVRSIRFLTLVVIEFYQDRCFTQASTLAFSASFALVPVSTFYFSVFAAFPSFRELINKARGFVLEQLVPQSNMKEEVIRYFNELTANVYGLTSISVISLVVTSALLYITIEDALNKVFAVRQLPSLQRSLVMFTNLLLWGPLLMGVSAYLWFESMRLRAVADLAVSPWGHFSLTFLVSWLMFLAAYWLLPYGHVTFIPALFGSLVGALLWEVAKKGFSLYLEYAFVYSIVYGSVGFIPISLLWVYTSCLIFLFGAKVGFCYQFRDMLEFLGAEAKYDPVLMTQATLASVLIIGRRFRRGETPPTIYDLSRQIRAPSYLIQNGLVMLEDKRILLATNRRKEIFLPARSLEAIPMQEVFWATFPQTPQITGEFPEALFVKDVVLRAREAITGVIRGLTLAQAVDDPAILGGDTPGPGTRIAGSAGSASPKP